MTANENQPPRAPTAEPAPDLGVPPAPAAQTPGMTPPATGPAATPAIKRTRVSGAWIAIAVAGVILVFLLIFILQNLASATVYYFGTVSTLPLGVALLLAAVGGALLVTLVGTARIVQLRRVAKRRGRSPTRPS